MAARKLLVLFIRTAMKSLKLKTNHLVVCLFLRMQDANGFKPYCDYVMLSLLNSLIIFSNNIFVPFSFSHCTKIFH